MFCNLLLKVKLALLAEMILISMRFQTKSSNKELQKARRPQGKYIYISYIIKRSTKIQSWRIQGGLGKGEVSSDGGVCNVDHDSDDGTYHGQVSSFGPHKHAIKQIPLFLFPFYRQRTEKYIRCTSSQSRQVAMPTYSSRRSGCKHLIYVLVSCSHFNKLPPTSQILTIYLSQF